MRFPQSIAVVVPTGRAVWHNENSAYASINSENSERADDGFCANDGNVSFLVLESRKSYRVSGSGRW